jgi:hypothetical protein
LLILWGLSLAAQLNFPHFNIVLGILSIVAGVLILLNR